MDALRAWLDDRGLKEGPLFTSRLRRRICGETLRRIVNVHAERAKIGHITPHMLRHTYGTEAANSGEIDIEVLQEMMGHSSLNTTRGYVKVAPSRLAEGFRKMAERRKEARILHIASRTETTPAEPSQLR